VNKPRPGGLTPIQFALVCVSVCAAVLANVSHLPLQITLLIVVLFLGRIIQRQRNGLRIPGWIKVPMVVLVPLIVIAHYGSVFGREPGSALACAMLTLKLLETESRRDARAAVTFASFVLMSALLFETSLWFTLLLFGALILLLATLRELEPRPRDSGPIHWQQSLRADLRVAAMALLTAIPLTVFAFVFFPRLDSPLWHTPGDTSGHTGIGDTMSPGAIQNLLIDDSPAFRVGFDGAPPKRGQLYWRGPVLTDFDGATWKRQEVIKSADRNTLQVSGAVANYEITLEPTDKPWLFALDIPLDVPTDDPVESQRGSDMTLMRRRPVADLLHYRAKSALDYRFDITLTERQRRGALRLPEGFDPRSVALGQSWRRDLGNDDAIIQAALELFHNAFFYTLTPPELGRDSIDDFLFETKRGFCEHFASSFVVLMRAAGIPARVVTGYQGGYFNAVGNYLLVRQSDAHAWSEVWLEGRGWVRIDPTAAVSPQRVEYGARAAAGDTSPWYQASWIIGIRNQFDLINRGWNSLIVQFNSLRQQSLLKPFGIEKADYATLTWILIASTSLLLAAIALWTMRGPRLRVDPLDRAYANLCSKLGRAGAERPPAEGPQDFARRLQGAAPSAGPLVRQAQGLIAHYVSLRYARALATDADVGRFARAVRKFRISRLQ
jgi:transglutaminase-like putative cysteine protease